MPRVSENRLAALEKALIGGVSTVEITMMDLIADLREAREEIAGLKYLNVTAVNCARRGAKRQVLKEIDRRILDGRSLHGWALEEIAALDAARKETA